MDIVEAIKQRKTIRAFKPDPVPREILKKIMELAVRAPSASNMQPWEFTIVQGKKLEEIKKAFDEKSGEPAKFDFSVTSGQPSEPYLGRRKGVLVGVQQTMGIAREDREKRMQLLLRGQRLWGANAAIYIYIESSLYKQGENFSIWPIFDCGLIAENIMLLATAYGLGTAPLAQAALYPDVLRSMLGIPDSKLIILGIAIGYPDLNDPINRFRSERAPLDEVVRWR